ncbi:MAG: hypothetical protein GQ553_05035 [Nitrosomonadaceae bacterium]|jgi:hypothetical protein|nr:hypothetical protein [Nitrosomonadaceae bacterium]
MQKPNISTAIPKQRYKFGVYTVVVLEEIESESEFDYVYLLAGIKDGHNEPEIYITYEKAPLVSSEKGSHIIRVFAKQLDKQGSGVVIDQSDSWKDREAFISYGLSGFQQMLQLQDEQAIFLS